MANELLLLKRNADSKGYRVEERFPLLNQVKKLEQASLF
jgi:hypothetical protein